MPKPLIDVMDEYFTANELKQFRADYGLSQADIPATLGYVKKTWQHWEQGRTCPDSVLNHIKQYRKANKL